MNNVLKSIIKILYGIGIALFTIGISVIITLNSKFIYHYSVNKHNLDKIGGISKENLLSDYSSLIEYLQNPFIKKLEFINFPMSANGEFHFYEVKKIFLFIYAITICVFLFFSILFCVKKFMKKKVYLVNVLNYGANTLIVTIATLLSAIVVDFSKTFIVFHKLFFNNDYWIFDEKTDPIIRVLPEEVFMIYSLFIIVLVILAIILYKILYYNNKYKVNNKRLFIYL
ncbi:MAG: TIGR01906 family membrane protein [Clostridium sartagoforme]|nr:TIGR01906 family membrane protein [Clostridium sartagoforme]